MTRKPLKLFLGIFLLLIFNSCANYKLHIQKSEENPPIPPENDLTYTMYLIGDAGQDTPSGMALPLAALKKHLEKAPANSSVIFLGDNIYPGGLPPRSSSRRKIAEKRLSDQLEILKNYKGHPYFIPGNHDWLYGLKGVNREEEFVEDYLGKNDVWFPKNGCGDPEIVEINDQLAILFIDTQWWLSNWDKEPEINAGCDVKSRKNFLFLFEEAAKKYRQKNLVIAMHHPLFSNGPHGGKYTFKQHVFPLTDLNKNLYVPLPALGTVFAFLRGAVGSRQDLAHPEYKALKKGLLGSAQKNGSFIFVAGHEHNLQYFEDDKQAFIISGSGSKRSPVAPGRGALFTYAAPGFSILKFYKDGSSWVEFWVTDPSQAEGKMIFSKKVKDPLPQNNTTITTDPEEWKPGQSKVTVTLEEGPQKKAFHRFLWGEHYRNVYHDSVQAAVLELNKAYGGLKPIKRGGGYQTNSLRLEASDGKQYVMRAILKDATRTVPYPFNQTFAKDIFADQFSAALPYGALIVPTLAQAAGIYHTNPKVFYVPKQPALGEYNDGFGDELYLFEERPGGDWTKAPNFGSSDKITDTPDVIKKRTKDYKNHIDAAFAVRSRIFDNLIGDWDRHDDQWQWATLKDPKTNFTTYRPIPRDRDQAFHKYDGLMISILRQSLPFVRQLRVYKPQLKNIKWGNYNGRNFDQTFLTEASWDVWEPQVREIQQNVTDQVIEQAVRQMPKSAFDLTGPEIIAKIKGRRENLMDIARRHYLLLARHVDVVGTEKRDYFEVTRLDDDHTRVRVYDSNKKGEKGDLYFDRTFLTSETKSVDLYGLDGEDWVVITGHVHKGILVRVIGGLEEDTFIDESSVGGLGKKTHIYDNKDKNDFKVGHETRAIRTNDPILNLYDRKAPQYEYDFGIPLPAFGFNPDDGFLVGLGLKYFHYGFKKSPYAASHTLGGQYAFATNSYNFTYSGEFIRAIRRLDLLLDGHFQGDLFTLNYFGQGNETVLLSNEKKDFDYNRVRQSLVGVYPTLRRRFGKSTAITLGISGETVEIEKVTDRFISTPDAQVPDFVFNHNYFGGGKLGFQFKNVDQTAFPTLGVSFDASVGYTANLQRTDSHFTTIASSLAFYIGTDRIVLASRIGGKSVTGDYLFYQGATLGGTDNLRGVRDERFTGGASFYHNTDVRIKLFKVENYYLPFTLGVLGGFDYGRVWLKGEESDKLHHSYGGGLWLSPFDAVVINLGLFKSEDGSRFQLRGGFLF